MRLQSSSYFVLSAVACACAGVFVIACSSDDGLISTAPAADAGPLLDGALPDREAADTSTTPDAYDGVIFTTAEIGAMKTMSPLLAVPADPTNAFADNAAAAVLGQRLFFDKSYSGALAVGDNGMNGATGAVGQTGTLSCSSCHSSKATDDGRSKPNNVSLGTGYGTRNALPIVNSSFYKWTNWGGRFDSQWSLPLAVAENPNIMKSSRLQIAHMLHAKYKTEYDAIFPVPLDAALDPAAADAARFPATGKPKAPTDPVDGPWELMTQTDRDIVMRIYANFGKAIAAYMRLLVSRNAAFDRFVAVVPSDHTGGNTIGEDARRGARIFLGKGKCTTCHSGPNFSDDQFHNIGLGQTGPNVPAIDPGRSADIPPLLASPFNTNGPYSDNTTTGKLTGLGATPANQGQFRTKSLRGLPASAPFMHSGQLATLDDVVQFYSLGGGSAGDGGVKDAKMSAIGLGTGEAADLVAFLKTLGGEDVPMALLTDTSK